MTALPLASREGPATLLVGAALASGGNGVVLEAVRSGADGSSRQAVAKAARRGQERLLELERATAESVEHRNLVRFLGTARSEEHGLLLAFERLGGNPLLLMNGGARRPAWRDPGTPYYPLPPGRALELAYDLAVALEALHARGLVHGDVKLANLLVRTPEAADPARVLAHVASGAFEGVLIDLGSVRGASYLADLAGGRADADLAHELTPLYAPPEALFELRERGGRKAYGPAMDAYAFGLVLHALLTGQVPYGDLCSAEELRHLDVVLELKTREARGELAPIREEALDAAPLHDVAFEGARAVLWPAFRTTCARLIARCTSVDPARRPSMALVRAAFETELRLRAAPPGAPRAAVQGLFQMRPRANRLVGDPALGGIRVTEEGARARGEEAPPPRPASAPAVIAVREVTSGPAPAAAHLKPEPVALSKLLIDRTRGTATRLAFPVLVTRTSLAPRDLARAQVLPLGESRTATIGRGTENDLVLADPCVSKKHVTLERDGDGWWIEDLRSANGTTVAGTLLDPGARARVRGRFTTIELGPDARLALMDEDEFCGFVERAIVVVEEELARMDVTIATRLRGLASTPVPEALPRAPTRRVARPGAAEAAA